MQEIESRKKDNPFNFKLFGINMEREKLYERINLRVDIMIKQGLIEEVKNIVKSTIVFLQQCKDLDIKR